MADPTYAGLLFVGDPHLATRAPGFRRDEYAETMLEKLAWCLGYARENGLAVVLLGDLFHHPRDVSNWLLVELIRLLDPPVWTVPGNHDCHENALTDHDTLAVLAAAGCVRLLDREGPQTLQISGGSRVVVGGSCWSDQLPERFDVESFCRDLGATHAPLVFWVTHHDVRFPGYEDFGRYGCFEVPGVDVVVNGHVHRTFPDVRVGRTTWMNPGSLCRINRDEHSRRHAPGALRFDIHGDRWTATRVAVPHRSFDDVFHPLVEPDQVPTAAGESMFIKELAALEAYRTASGAGLEQFLEANLRQFDPRVAEEIRDLAKEVLTDAAR